MSFFNRYITFSAVLLLGFAAWFVFIKDHENWPKVSFPNYEEKLKAQKNHWAKNNYDPSNWFEQHTATGRYLNRSHICKPKEPDLIDGNGLVMMRSAEGIKYNPVMLAQCGLSAYGKWLKTNERIDLSIATAYADKLIELQDQRGAFPYDYTHQFYVTKEVSQPGWTSAMAQGQAMSLFVRVFDATGDRKYVESGRLALHYLLTPIDKGGVRTTMADLDPSLKNYVFFEEHVTKTKDNYILNGYMFALLGLYDWSKLHTENNEDQNTANNFFKEGMQTLEKILPYYDADGLSVYDLTHYTHNNNKLYVTASYTGVHVYLLHALHSITDSSTVKKYEDKWHNDLIDIAKSGGAG